MSSGVGRSRSGAIGSTTSKISPATKRAALTLPSRYLAAISGRAGVRRGSSIAFAKQFEDRPRSLAFAALGASGFGRRRPGIDVEMQPAPGAFDEALQEQCAGDRAGEAARGRVVEIGDLRIQPGIVGRPQRHPPQWIVLLSRTARDVLRQRFVIGVE